MGNKDLKNIIIMGPQGSGKSTQAQMLAERLNLKHVSLGNEFRKFVAAGSALGKQVEKYLVKGELVPHHLVMKVIEQVVPQNGFILEGFPRELRQARGFKRQIDKVIYISNSDEVGIERILKGTKVGGLGIDRRQRQDDTLPAIKKRLKLYHQMTEPVLDFYRKGGILKKVNGEGSIEEVFQAILKIL